MTAQTIPQKATDTHLLDIEIIKEPPPRLREYRCKSARCNRLLFRAHLATGTEIEARCPNCHRTHIFYGPTNGKIHSVTEVNKSID